MMLFLFFIIVLFALCLKLVFAGVKLLFVTGGVLIGGLIFIPLLILGMFALWGLLFFIIPLIVVGFIASKVVNAIC